ncbi:LuxR family transcriptional regulator [Tomitella fengzijianii]|uniref:LuxR family transcriptional regulator n=1 Tax=Tomitella fengzijianii TaxID=2597660 RepID=A0A516X8S6_9ACTN|nr:LuxR family transcriptional regulator [Tomitella fengzijianii]
MRTGTTVRSRDYQRPTLSHREIEVLRCWLLSDSKTEVSGKLHVAPGTIKSHLHRIRGKYEAVGRNAGTKASLVARALQDGILSLEEL